jgi:hypothetical protein
MPMKSDIATIRPQFINFRRLSAVCAVIFAALAVSVAVGISTRTGALNYLIDCGCIVEEVSASDSNRPDRPSVSGAVNNALRVRLLPVPVRVSIQRRLDETISKRIAMIGDVRVVSCFCDVPPAGEYLSPLIECGDMRHFMATIAAQPSGDVLEKCIGSWPHLVSWSVDGGEYGDRVVDTLASRRELRAAFLSGHQVSAAAVERMVVSANTIETVGVAGISGMDEECAKRLSKTRSGVRVFWESRVFFDGNEL